MLSAGCAAAKTVEGIVFNSVTPTLASRGLHVLLQPVAGETHYSATTEALGHFFFKDVKTGAYLFQYTSRATKKGAHLLQKSEPSSRRFSSGVQDSDGCKDSDLIEASQR
jgi:hypothetical protein